MEKVTLFSHILPEEQERMWVCFQMREVVYENNEIIMEYTNTMKKIGLIAEGQASLYGSDAEGNQYLMDELKKGDVLLTMDGGTSIGKSAVFDLDDNFTVDSHVAILRPVGISPKAMAYLLASPMGQLQFNRAESGASGQTAVTEEDLRRFQFPRALLKNIEDLAEDLDKKRKKINEKKKALEKEEFEAWNIFSSACLQQN